MENKFNSPKVCKKTTINSSSNLPTANNSFHTISSPDHDKNNLMDEYQGLQWVSMSILITGQGRTVTKEGNSVMIVIV
jgi:hypothetical protein